MDISIHEKYRTSEVHMEEGPIGKTLLLFTVPVLASQILQQLYSAADCMIVGHFGGADGLAAAGEASLILSVIINFFVGFSTGVSAVTGAAFGAKNYKKLSQVIHVVILMSLAFGAVMTGVGILFTRNILLWINCPEQILDASGLYLKICMIGIIPQLLYNTCNAVLRSLGNTKEPLYFLMFSSLMNLILDFLFVVGFGWGLPGAGVATVLSQWALAFVMLYKMSRLDSRYSFSITRLFSGQKELSGIIRIGLPSGMQAVFMSISSMVIQYSINSFGADAAAGMVVFARVESFLYYPAFSYGTALTGFIGQNYGAGRMDRVREGMKKSILYLTAFTIAAEALLILFTPALLKLFTPDPEIFRNGQQAILCIIPFYFLYSIDQVYIGGLRGLKNTGYPMICALICYCIFRVAWCQLLLPFIHDIRVVYFAYNVSLLLMLILLIPKYRNVFRHLQEKKLAAAA